MLNYLQYVSKSLIQTKVIGLDVKIISWSINGGEDK